MKITQYYFLLKTTSPILIQYDVIIKNQGNNQCLFTYSTDGNLS